MDFAFNEDQDLLRDSTRRFLEDRHSLRHVRAILETDDVFDRAVWRQGAELGWTAMLVPPEFDGGSVTDQPVVDLIVLAEELGRVLYPGPFIPTNVVAGALAASGSELQRKELLPLLAAGERVAAWCTTSDGSPYRSSVGVTATLEADQYRLNGVAGFVHGAASADVLMVAATSPAGLVQLLVPRALEGVSVRGLTGLDLTRRLAEVRFDGVLVPASALIGSPGPEAERVLEAGFQL
ncbi:MAG: acyl-CoA dehydrogenase, partial [Acidimicrobiia bacterium]|nr:acyl-CoA dehydrogenase [Acidimicrobiia bacterium]